MNIIIVGDGKVGYTLAKHLSKENHNITIIDNNAAALQKADSTLDVMCVSGNGARPSVLMEAGITEADLLIAVTSKDELNIVACLISKNLAPSVKTIARIRDPEYHDEFVAFQHGLSMDMVINPDLAAAHEIANILQFPTAMDVELFFGGRERMVEFRVQEGDFLAGSKIVDMRHKLPKNILFAAVERGGQAHIPNGDFVFQVGDIVYIMGQLVSLKNLFKLLGRYTQKIHTVLIVGGSRLSYYLTKLLLKIGMTVKIIEIDPKRCAHLAEMLPEAVVIQGDGTDTELLESENIEDTDAFISMTGIDEENLLIASYAQDKGVDKVVAVTARTRLNHVVSKLGLDSVINAKLITVGSIIAYVRGIQNSQGSVVETLHKIMHGKAEVIGFIANQSTRFLNIPLKDLPLKSEILIACIMHDNVVTIPHGEETIQANDKVLIVSKGHHILSDLNDILQ